MHEPSPASGACTRHAASRPVLPQTVHDRNKLKQTKNNVYCASTHTYLMFDANGWLSSLILIFPIIVFYFSNVCEYINMYYWWWRVVVPSTRMRFSSFFSGLFVFFDTQNVSNFWGCLLCFVFYSGCYYWGLEMTGTAVPLCSASNKMTKTHCLSTFPFG